MCSRSDLPIEVREMMGETPDDDPRDAAPEGALWGPGYRHPQRVPATRTIKERHARTPGRTVAQVLERAAWLRTVHGDCLVRVTDEAVEFVVPLGAPDLAHLRAELEAA